MGYQIGSQTLLWSPAHHLVLPLAPSGPCSCLASHPCMMQLLTTHSQLRAPQGSNWACSQGCRCWWEPIKAWVCRVLKDTQYSVSVCFLAVTGLNADSELGLNAKSNQVTKIVQNCNKTVQLLIVKLAIEKSSVPDVYIDLPVALTSLSHTWDLLPLYIGPCTPNHPIWSPLSSGPTPHPLYLVPTPIWPQPCPYLLLSGPTAPAPTAGPTPIWPNPLVPYLAPAPFWSDSPDTHLVWPNPNLAHLAPLSHLATPPPSGSYSHLAPPPGHPSGLILIWLNPWSHPVAPAAIWPSCPAYSFQCLLHLTWVEATSVPPTTQKIKHIGTYLIFIVKNKWRIWWEAK